jgi:hypothetical protein
MAGEQQPEAGKYKRHADGVPQIAIPDILLLPRGNVALPTMGTTQCALLWRRMKHAFSGGENFKLMILAGQD